MRRWALAAPVLALVGCSVTTSPAARRADERAERAGIVMTREDDAVAMVRRVVGSVEGARIGALVAEGDRWRGRIVLRITERVEATSDWDEPDEAVRCYEYELANSIDDHEPATVDCPDRPALVLPPPPPPVVLPDQEAIRQVLAGFDPASATEAAVLAALRDLAGDVPILDVERVGGTIGAVVGDGDGTCVSAALDARGVDVWTVPRVVAQPGELGCAAANAARRLGTDSPH